MLMLINCIYISICLNSKAEVLFISLLILKGKTGVNSEKIRLKEGLAFELL